MLPHGFRRRAAHLALCSPAISAASVHPRRAGPGIPRSPSRTFEIEVRDSWAEWWGNWLPWRHGTAVTAGIHPTFRCSRLPPVS